MPEPSTDDFTKTLLPSIGKRVFRLGLAGNYGIATADVEYAAERGINFWLWGRRFGKVTPALREILRKDREGHVVSVLGSALLTGGVRRGVEGALRALNTDYIDCFKLGWLGRMSRLSDGICDALLQLKQEGKVRSVGCSIHDRPRAGQLARESVFDTFMLRYNAKHTGAEQDIFPELHHRNPTVIAYTATSWRQLTRPLKDIDLPPWPGAETGVPPLTAALCYRFCLTNPHVHVVLTGPKNRAQLDENLKGIAAGALSEAELNWVRNYGAEVKRKQRLDYI